MSDFFKILFTSELKALSGRSMRTIGALVSILLFTILALGLAYGTLDSLKERMDNPYTNWVDVPVTVSIEPKVDDILNHFKRQENLDKYKLSGVTRYDVYYAQFLHANQKDTFYLRGRTVESDERILQSVLQDIPGNVIVEHSSLKEIPCGIIVTGGFLKALGYTGDLKSVLKISMPYNDNIVLLDILAVVIELPNLCDFISGPILPNMRNLATYETGFIDETVSNVVPVIVDHKLSVDEIEKLTASFQDWDIVRINELEHIAIIGDRDHTIYQLVFPLEAALDNKEFIVKLRQSNIGSSSFMYKETNCNDRFASVPSPDHFAFQFNNLDKIRDFKNGMLEDFDIEVSMQQIESAENFSLVSTLTFTTSLVLFGFALLSIGFYISSLIRSHLQKIAANLGTMKAFGLRNVILTRVYISIIGIFCIGSAIVSMGVAILIQIGLRSGSMKFDIDVLNLKVILALVVIVLLCLYLAYRSTTKILGNTPGDLIYKRND